MLWKLGSSHLFTNRLYSTRVTINDSSQNHFCQTSYYSICNIIRLSVIACSQLNTRVCVFACICSKQLQNVCICTIFVCFNIAHYFVNTLLPRCSFCYRISRTPAEEAENCLTKIISKNELNLHGICIAVIIKSNYRYLYNGCAWIKKGLWQPEEDLFFVGFFFSSLSGTLRSMKIKRHGHLCPTRVTSLQLAISPGLRKHI